MGSRSSHRWRTPFTGSRCSNHSCKQSSIWKKGLDAQIHKAAGDELRDFCTAVRVEQRKLNLPPCPVTTNVVSSSFNLKERFKHIIHVVSPDCRRPNQDETRRELLPQTYHHLFDTLKGMKDVSVVMAPPLSMGFLLILTVRVLV